MIPISAEHHISGVYTKMLMGFLAETMPTGDIQALLARAGETRTLDEVADPASWSSYDQFKRLLEERSRLDPASLYEQSGLVGNWLRTWELSQVAQTFDTPSALLAAGSALNPLVPIRRYDKTEVGPNEWMIREWFEDGYAPFPEFCDFAALQYAVVPVVFNLPPGDVIEEECQCRGDAVCLFRLRWQHRDTDSSKADRYRVRAELSEAQLEQIQEMITNLASNESYEDVLQGFVRSSLRTAVGAGGALLVLEPRAGWSRKVYSEGLTEVDAESMAEDLLAGEAVPDKVVAVDVASARRHYGVLAINEGGGVFSSLSQSTLETHARLAAAALDTADALDEARHQANTAQALLDLSTSLTEIVSTQAMASKVAHAVPDIIDCDRAAVFLDSADVPNDGVRLVGSTGYSDEEVALIRSQAFTTAPHNSLIDNGIVHGTLAESASAAFVSAPIVVAGETIGSIVASVTAEPERLTVTPRLAHRLKGLAAQASTAISNARLVDQIRFQAVHDALTGLPNRALILDRTDQMLARAHRSDIQVAALFIDLDGFKDVNDSFGHGVGDQLLQAVAERLSLTMRQSDSIGRLGGDEFVVLVDGSTMDAGPELVAERLLEVLRAPFEFPGLLGKPLTLTASIGIATGVRPSASELLRDADIALYEAKAAGKNCFVAFEPEMHAVVQDHHLLEMDLREALAAHQYHLVYQPIFNLSGGQTTGVEALLRWDHPVRGLVQPDNFIPLLEDTGMITEVGRWVLNEACRQGARWHAKGYQLDVSVNVSARQLETEQLVEDVRLALHASGFPASSLILEITETAIMKHVAAAVPRLAALKATGVRIAIDDFGTGYSSLAYLQQFPVDTLKIDRSFISAMAKSPESAALIRTLVQLGKTLGLETLAEGIEEREQYSQLEREHCDSGQGYLYARPLDVDAVETFVAGRPRVSDRAPDATDVRLPTSYG
ncbi:MAG: EAL domain-containing protein [Acidimicrobiales bacterium]|jgi:diguanylate cyclase (GGDEF)-like protein